MHTEEFLDIYSFSGEERNADEYLEALRDKNIKKYRIKTIKSGQMLECEIYPIWNAPRIYSRARKKPTRKAQQNLNDKNTKKKLIRLINANFNEEDIWATFTYDKNNLPSSIEEAKKDMVNYLRRLNRHIKKNDLPPLKYIYVTEHGKKRVHHHIIMNFADRDIVEAIWDRGRKQTRRLQPDDYGLEGLARYVVKGPATENNQKKYTCSKNLEKPKVTTADTKISKKRAEKIARDPNMATEIFQKLYEGYLFKDIKISYSDFVPGAYLYVRMKQKDVKKPRGKI